MGEKIERVFATTQLIEWGILEPELCEHVVDCEELGMSSFESECAVVFRAPDDGHLWRFTYEYNSGAGYNDITGLTYGADAEPETAEFKAVRVEQVFTFTTAYEPLCKGQESTESRLIKGQIMGVGDFEPEEVATGLFVALSREDTKALAHAGALYSVAEIVVRSKP